MTPRAPAAPTTAPAQVDGSATQEVTVYSELFDQYRDLCQEDNLLVIEAKVKIVRRSAAGEEGDISFMRVIADKIYDLAAAPSHFARGIRLSINGLASHAGAAVAAHLKDLLAPYRDGNCQVNVCYSSGAASCEVLPGRGLARQAGGRPDAVATGNGCVSRTCRSSILE